ncbi:immunoglobulin omega chain-like [Pimephales promelas]|uniref:immunoglobulin omega chain-like n=1 Tax=Pimephales promelas TaxID=90988 RepID=UPI001955BDCC|nr:immunoglobulin omega chain-like [Pimephales promelas]
MSKWAIITLFFTAHDLVCRGQDNVDQPLREKTSAEGNQVTLLCNYTITSSANAYLFWYKQLLNRSPTFILSEFTVGKGTTEPDFKKRFSATLDSTSRSVPLTIQDDVILWTVLNKLQDFKLLLKDQLSQSTDVSVSDSAVYYCALATTVTGNTSTLYKNLSQPKVHN